jgi:hypothetical protein
VDSFERNLENAQIEMNVEPPNFVPVIYKTELEAASFTGIIPTLIIIGNILFTYTVMYVVAFNLCVVELCKIRV